MLQVACVEFVQQLMGWFCLVLFFSWVEHLQLRVACGVGEGLESGTWEVAALDVDWNCN